MLNLLIVLYPGHVAFWKLRDLLVYSHKIMQQPQPHPQWKIYWFYMLGRDVKFFFPLQVLFKFLLPFVVFLWVFLECNVELRFISLLCSVLLSGTDFSLAYDWHWMCMFCVVANVYGSTIGKLSSVTPVVLSVLICVVDDCFEEGKSFNCIKRLSAKSNWLSLY